MLAGAMSLLSATSRPQVKRVLATPPESAAPAVVTDGQTNLLSFPKMRRLHLVRPDLLLFPIQFEVYA
jgi:hypothetical protein